MCSHWRLEEAQSYQSSLSAWRKFAFLAIQNAPSEDSGPEVKLFSCSTQLSMKFLLLINLKLPTIANSFLLNKAEHEIFSANKYENANFVGIFIFISGENFMLSWVEHEKSFITSGPDHNKRMWRLIWIFVGYTWPKVHFLKLLRIRCHYRLVSYWQRDSSRYLQHYVLW